MRVMCELDIGQTVTIYNSVRALATFICFFFPSSVSLLGVTSPRRLVRDGLS